MNRKYEINLQGEKIGLYIDTFSSVARPILAIVSLSILIFERNSRHHNILFIINYNYGCALMVQSSRFHEKTATTQPNPSHHSLFLFAARGSKVKPT